MQRSTCWPHSSLLRVSVLVVLAAVTVAVLGFVWQFTLTRFFTLDEYQWGHATWLIHEGKVPYRDFYEHHLPLGYIFHSLFYSDTSSFTDNALTLRKIAFAYIIIACVSVAALEYVKVRDPFTAITCAALPVSIGFGLMSAIDYRGDNWSTFLVIAGYAVINVNQTLESRVLSALAGSLFSVALLMTQKTLLVTGVAIGCMLVISFWQSLGSRPPAWVAQQLAQRIAHPGVFCVAGALPLVVLSAIGAKLGVLDAAFEITVLQALDHERLYPAFSVWRYLEPYLTYAPVSSTTLLVAAFGYMVRGRHAFWALPTLSSLLGVATIKAPYPYNFVLPSFLLGICAVGGYAKLIRWAFRRWPRLASGGALWHLVPPLLIPAQLGFVCGGTSNDEQLETLRRIEQYTAKDDVVIDSDGSALFRPDRGYYWYQGRAHVLMFANYYREQFVTDLRATQAPFWLNGLRSKQLPDGARAYLLGHYIPFRGDLFVLGFKLSQSTAEPDAEQTIDVVRDARYYVSCEGPPSNAAADGRARNSEIASSPLLDGSPVSAGSVWLARGPHRVQLPAGGRTCQVSYLPPSTFETSVNIYRHAPLFEYDRPR